MPVLFRPVSPSVLHFSRAVTRIVFHFITIGAPPEVIFIDHGEAAGRYWQNFQYQGREDEEKEG